MGRKPYTKQFKEQAMKLVSEQGYSAAHAARELNMPFNTLASGLRSPAGRRSKLHRHR